MSQNINEGSNPSPAKTTSVLFQEFFSAVTKMRDHQVIFDKRGSNHNRFNKVRHEVKVDQLIFEIKQLLPELP